MATDIDIGEIRELAKKYSVEQIEACISEEMETGKNVCLLNPSAEVAINELAKAEFVRERIEKGLTLAEAIRELAKRMRAVQNIQKGYEG